MKKNIIIGILFPLLLTGCFGLDNYDAPDAGIDGKLLDAETGAPVYTEQPDGCRIELMDLSYENPTPLYFWTKANGSFRNVALFSGAYDVTPVEGPFFPIESEKVILKKVTSHDFRVTPYLQVELVEIEKGEEESGEVKVRYTIKRSETPEGYEIGQKTISEAWVLCNDVPIVSYYNSGYNADLSVKREFSRTTDTNIENTVYETTLSGLESGKTYYIRIAALSSCSYNTLKRYNYTETLDFVAP